MDLFELQAKIKIDDSEYKKSAKEAAQSADDIEDALKDASKAADKAEDSIDGLGDTAKKTSKSTDGLGESVENTKDSLVGSIVKADLFTGALSKLGGIAMDVAEYVWNLDEATEEYRVAQGKLTTAFKTNGFSANTAKDAYQGLYRVVGDIDRATEASQLLSQLAKNTEDVSSWTTIATGVVGTFGDSLPVESLIESANESARVGQVVGTLADALNWAGMVGEDEFNVMLANCETQEERVDLITQTLMETYEDAADTFEEANGTLLESRDAFAKVQDAAAEAGEAVSNLKNEMADESSLAGIGFHKAFGDLANTLSSLIGQEKSQLDLYQDWVSTTEQKLSTGSIEEATEAFEDLGRVVAYFEEHPIDAIFQFGGFFSSYGAQKELDGLLETAETRFSGTGEAAEGAAEDLEKVTTSAEDLEESLEPVIATAGNVSVELQGSGLTAEEASGRLKTYTDAAADMFSKISEESELSYEDAVSNLEANVQAVENFATNMESVAGDLPPQLAELFAAGGPQMYAGVVSMLAEANEGADVGLTKLNELYEKGGDAAVEAFVKSLGVLPEETQNPAKVVAAQMEEDTAMEAASVGVVSRTSDAMADAVDSAGFDGSGQNAMVRFVNGLESKRSLVVDKARSLAEAAKKEIDLVLDNIGGGGTGGSARAGGLDYVPTNGYPAVLHRGEAVLTAREADEWRGGGYSDNSRKIEVNQYISVVPQTPAEFAATTEAYLEQAVWRL